MARAALAPFACIAAASLAATLSACAVEPLGTHVDPLGLLRLVATNRPGRSFVLLPGPTGVRAAVARDLESDVWVVDLTDPNVEPTSVGVGLGPRGIAHCPRPGGALLVTADTTASSLTLLSDAGGAFSVVATIARDRGPLAVTCRPAASDGSNELVVAEGIGAQGGRVAVLRIAPDETVTELTTVEAAGVVFAEEADLDGDGTDELVTTASDPAAVSIFARSAGSALAFGAPEVLTPCGSPAKTAVAKIDGDGGLDLAIACRDDALAVVFDPLGSKPREISLPVEGQLYDAALVDLDSDGALDCVTVDVSTHQAIVWMALRDAPLRGPTYHEVPRGPVALAIGDVDLDGDPDVVVLSYEERALGLLINGTP